VASPHGGADHEKPPGYLSSSSKGIRWFQNQFLDEIPVTRGALNWTASPRVDLEATLDFRLWALLQHPVSDIHFLSAEASFVSHLNYILHTISSQLTLSTIYSCSSRSGIR
jgi:hypothetical protein